MLGGILDAVKGCMKEEMRMDIISNNLSNSSVVGFKKEKITFQEILEEAGNSSGQNKVRSGGVDDSALIQIKTDFTQGDIRFTGNPLDLAINGKGFFKVQTPDGTRYTRKGNFTLDNQGTLITGDGHKVMGGGGAITLIGNDIQISGQGLVKVDGNDVGSVDFVNFENSEVLTKVGRGLYAMPSEIQGQEVPPDPETKIQQGYIELSNVNAADEMIQMIHSLRAFESYQKAIQVLDSCNRRAINEVSRLR